VAPVEELPDVLVDPPPGALDGLAVEEVVLQRHAVEHREVEEVGVLAVEQGAGGLEPEVDQVEDRLHLRLPLLRRGDHGAGVDAVVEFLPEEPLHVRRGGEAALQRAVLRLGGVGAAGDDEAVDVLRRVRRRLVDHAGVVPLVVEVVPQLRAPEVGRVVEHVRPVLGVDVVEPEHAERAGVLAGRVALPVRHRDRRETALGDAPDAVVDQSLEVRQFPLVEPVADEVPVRSVESDGDGRHDLCARVASVVTSRSRAGGPAAVRVSPR